MAQRGQFRVSVSRDDLVFSSAHFITYAGHRCEGLHGHNYRARVAVHGELDPTDKLVFDFLELKRIMRRLCGEIDHLVLLPLESARIHVAKDAEVVRVSVGPLETARRWRADRNTGQVRPQRLVTAGLASGALPPARVGPSFAAFHGPFAHCVRTAVPVNTQVLPTA